MRNLKRALSLALASVMLLGMMVVGTSAASYTDVDDNDNVEAIEVLNAVEVMIGRQGNFEPDEAVNRHEMAVIMAKLYLGSEEADNYVGSHPFTDVVSWADKYVAACYENNLISGTSATTYSGSQPLTAVQAALMMLRALGYEHLTKDATDWRAPVTAMANKIGLFKDVVSSPNAQLTRNEVAQLALNALESDMVEFTGELGWEINGVTLGFQAKWEPRKDFGNTTNNGYNYTNDSGTTHQKEYLQLLESLYDGKLIKDTKDYDDFDRPATTWKYKGKVIGSYMNTPDLTYTKEVKLGDIYKDLGLNKTLDSADVDFYRNGQEEDVTTNQIKANDNSTLLSGVGLTKGDSHKIGANGVLTQVWYDSTDETAIITMIDTFVGKVNSTGTSNGNRYVVVNPVSDGEGQINISTVLINPYYQFETEKFAVKDMVTFTAAYSDGTTRHEVQSVDALELTTTGTLTRWEGSAGTNSTPTGLSGANFSVEGTKYNYSRNYRVADDNGGASAVRFFTVNKSDVNVYLDKYGYAIYVSGVETQKNYAAVIGVGLTNQYGSETRGVTLLLPDGTQKTVVAKLANDANWDTMSAIAGNSKLVGIDQIPSGDTTDAGKNLVSDGIADLVTYSVGDDNVYTLTVVSSAAYNGNTPVGSAWATGSYKATVSATPTATDAYGAAATFKNGKSEIEFTTKFADVSAPLYTTAAVGKYYTTSDTVFFVATNKTIGVPADGVKYSVYTGYQNAPTLDNNNGAFNAGNVYGVVFAMNDYYTNRVDAVYIYANKVAGTSGVDTYFVKAADANVITDNDGYAYYELPAIVKGEVTTINISADLSRDWDGDNTNERLDAVNNGGTAIEGVFGIENVITSTKDGRVIITSCDLVDFNKKTGNDAPDTVTNDTSTYGLGTIAANGIVLGLGVEGNNSLPMVAATVNNNEGIAYDSGTKVYEVSKDYKEITAKTVTDVITDSNDLVWANWNSDAKVLTDVIIVKVDDTVAPPLPSVTNYVAGFLGCGNGSKNVQVVLRAPDMHYLSRNELAALNIKPEDITVTTNGFELHPFAADGEKGTIYGPGSGDTQGTASQHSFATNPIAILPGYAYDGYSATKTGGMLNTYGANAGFLKIHLDGMLESGTLTITIKGSNGVTYTCEAYTVG